MAQPIASMPDCRASLIAFAEMKLNLWNGLPVCTRADFEVALGAVGLESPSPMGRIRRYSGRAATPNGVEACFVGDHAVHVVAYTPQLTKTELETKLGAPDARVGSRLFEPHYDQWIYAVRGLVAHIDKAEGIAGRVYGVPSTSVDAFRGSPLYTVEAHEYPVE